MSRRPSAWQALLDATAPEVDRGRERRKLTREEQSEINQALWTALDASDTQGLVQALANGASPGARRSGVPPLWEAVFRSQWDVAEALVKHGADVNARTTSEKSLWTAIGGRNSIADIQRLLAWGCEPALAVANDFVKAEATELLEWWLLNVEGAHPIALSERREGEKVKMWLRVGAKGSQALRDALNLAWGIDPKDPEGLAKAWGGTGRERVMELWQLIAREDNVGKAKACIASGWGWPAPRMNTTNPKEQYTFLWDMVDAGGSALLKWIRGVPQFRQEMDTVAQQAPKLSWWPIAAKSVAGLMRTLENDVDIRLRDEEGSTVAHAIMSGYLTKKPMVDFWLKNHPDMLTQENHAGQTPLHKLHERSPDMAAYAQQALLGASAPKLSARRSQPRI